MQAANEDLLECLDDCVQLVASVSAECELSNSRWQDPDFDPAVDEQILLYGHREMADRELLDKPSAWIDIHTLGDRFEPPGADYECDVDSLLSSCHAGSQFGRALAVLGSAHQGSCPLVLYNIFAAYNNTAG